MKRSPVDKNMSAEAEDVSGICHKATPCEDIVD
jgi:hypothetical protein